MAKYGRSSSSRSKTLFSAAAAMSSWWMTRQINGIISRVQKLVADVWQISLFNCLHSWPAHPSWTPHQKSQLLGTRSVIQQLGEGGGSGGVWGKLETSGETAILRVLLVSLASFLLSFCLSLSNEEDRGSTISTKFEIWDFSAFWILNFLLTLVDWSNIYDDALWTRSVFKYWSKEPQHWVEHQCIAITYLFLVTR